MGGLFFQIQFAYSVFTALVAPPISQLHPRELEPVSIYLFYAEQGAQPFDQDTKWVRVIDSNLKNTNGQTLRDVLIDILDKFPNYDLQSKQGSEAAIHDIESKLKTVEPLIKQRTSF